MEVWSANMDVPATTEAQHQQQNANLFSQSGGNFMNVNTPPGNPAM
jgi:hypothetical protein